MGQFFSQAPPSIPPVSRARKGTAGKASGSRYDNQDEQTANYGRYAQSRTSRVSNATSAGRTENDSDQASQDDEDEEEEQQDDPDEEEEENDFDQDLGQSYADTSNNTTIGVGRKGPGKRYSNATSLANSSRQTDADLDEPDDGAGTQTMDLEGSELSL